MSEWIKCSERMPEMGERVLGYFDVGNGGHVEDLQFFIDEYEPLRHYHVLFDGDSMCCEPTHWQPLPSLPEAS